MKLHTYFRSSCAYRVRIALNYKQLAYESVTWHLQRGQQRSEAYLKVNPLGLIPALEHDGQVLLQSLAIIEYLEERFPALPLLPRSPAARALARSLALDIASEMHPLNNLRVLAYLRTQFELSEDKISQWYRHWIAEGLRPLELRARASSADGTCLVGREISLADVCLVPQLFNARRFKCSLEDLPTLCGIDEALRRHPAFAAAAPELQPDFEAS